MKLEDLGNHLDNRLDRLEDKLDDHLERISKAEEAIVFIKGHIQIVVTFTLATVGTAIAWWINR